MRHITEFNIYNTRMEPTKKTGRKPINPGEPMLKKIFTVSPMTVRKLRAMGVNMSETLRRAVDEKFERYQRE